MTSNINFVLPTKDIMEKLKKLQLINFHLKDSQSQFETWAL